MERNLQDAMMMIAELHYDKRMLEEELKTVREQALKLMADNESAQQRMIELEASMNGQPKKKTTGGVGEK